MADLTPIFQAAGAQYNVDPAILRALAQQESSMRPDAVNPASGASGLMGFTPATAKAYGINPLDPQQAIPAAAKMFSENLQRFNGNVEDAVAAHFAGPDQKMWGPKTSQYVGNVSNIFQQLKQGSPAPVVTPQSQAQGADPVLAMAQSLQSGASGSAPSAAPQSSDPVLAMAQGIANSKGASAVAAPSAATPQTTNAQASQPGVLASIGAGVGRGVQQTALGAQQLLGHGLQAVGMNGAGNWLVNDADQGLARGAGEVAPYQAAHPVATTAGNIGGQIAATAPLAAIAPEAAGAGVLGRAATGAALGGASAALTPVENLQPGQTFAGQKLQQIGLGAGLGAAAAPVAGMVGDVIQGAGGAAQRQLAQNGVTMTPGQILGGGWNKVENTLTSIPLVGSLIKGGQDRAMQQFNRATYDQVLAPLGQKYAGPVGQEGVEAVQQTIGDAYDKALSNLTFKATDPQFQTDITNLSSLAQNLPPAQQQTFMRTLQTQVFGKLSPQGWMDGQTLKGAQAELSRISRGYSGDASFDNRQLGSTIGEIKNAIDNSLPRYNAPDAVSDLTNANAAYANFVRLRGAASSQGAMNDGGVFTPAQLQNAVKANDKSVGKGASATGNALMQGWSQDAMTALGKGYPDSGTAGRLGTAGAIGALIAHPQTLLNPSLYMAALPSLAYTPYGQKLAQALLMSRPAGAQAVGQAVNRFLPAVSALGVPALANGAQR